MGTWHRSKLFKEVFVANKVFDVLLATEIFEDEGGPQKGDVCSQLTPDLKWSETRLYTANNEWEYLEQDPLKFYDQSIINSWRLK